MDDLKYLSGFGSHIETEAMEGALPVGQNSPQKVAYGLYAEQLSGTAFTAPRCKNQRSWLYRIRPRVLQQVADEAATQIDYGASSPDQSASDMDSMFVSTPKQMRWSPAEPERQDVDFVDGLQPVCGAGNSSMKEGMCIYNYVFNKDMKQARGGRTMCNADGDFLIVPQQGALAVYTEMGNLLVKPCEILVIPRGVVFSVNWQQSGGEDVTFARGYIAELFKGHLELPNLGPLGANGLANPRDFLAPVAAFEDVDGDDVSYSLVHKFHGKLFEGTIAFSPFDVVAWHGNYYPYKYDLNRFNTVNTVSFDHPDPSIFTVLTAQTDEPGVAALDFVIFPPRWMVAENTFRPPYFHRNCMSEYMGMVYGRYDNKATGFYPGGASLHPCMSAHGADATTFEKASEKVLEPEYFEGGLAFMFESTYLFKVSKRAMAAPTNQGDYMDCWKDIKKLYTGKK
jgi:homogentisate 1,2-dioxygenase